MLQLSAQDSQFLYMDSDKNLSNATMVSIYAMPQGDSATPAFALVKQYLLDRLHTSPIFTRKLVRVPLDLDYPYWVDDIYFDVESHLHLQRLPAPGNWAQFNDLIGKIHSRPLDMNRPVWEMHVVENLDGIPSIPAGSFGLVTKIHHSAVDGTSAMKFFASLSDLDAKGTPATDISVTAESSGAAPSSRDIWRRCLVNHVRSPLKLSETLWRATPAIVPAAIKALSGAKTEGKKSKVPKSLFNQKVSPHKIFAAVEFELADFKAIQKSVSGAKLNDVVLAVCSGAVREYLLRQHELPAESLVGWVPINARPARQKGESKSLDGNHVSAMAVSLSTGVADPLARLAEITRHTQRSKTAKSGVAARLMTDVSKHMPGATMAMATRLIVASGLTAKLCNLAITNVPGPQVPLYLNGAKCLHQYGMVPLAEGMGLFFVVCSYNGKLSISITTTRDVVPDTKVLCACLNNALAELKQAAAKQKGIEKHLTPASITGS